MALIEKAMTNDYRKPYNRGRHTLEVTCRCGKSVTTFAAWKQHLRTKHPKLYQAMRDNGELEQDRIDFHASKGR